MALTVGNSVGIYRGVPTVKERAERNGGATRCLALAVARHRIQVIHPDVDILQPLRYGLSTPLRYGLSPIALTLWVIIVNSPDVGDP